MPSPFRGSPVIRKWSSKNIKIEKKDQRQEGKDSLCKFPNWKEEGMYSVCLMRDETWRRFTSRSHRWVRGTHVWSCGWVPSVVWRQDKHAWRYGVLPVPEAQLERIRISKMELFAAIVKGWMPSTISRKPPP